MERLELLRQRDVDRSLVQLLRCKLGLRHAHRAGYGWRWDEQGHRVPDLAERETMALIAELRGQGMSYPQIAQALAERGILTSGGRPWSHDRVRRAHCSSTTTGRQD